MRPQARPTPAYREVADQLREQITRQGAGARLPTEAELSRRHGLSRQTVRRAYQDLVSEGLVRRIPGRGTFAIPPGPYVRLLGSIEDVVVQPDGAELEVVSPLRTLKEPAPGLVEQLGSERVMEARARRLRDGLPVSLTVISVPAAVGRHLVRARLLTRVGALRASTYLPLIDQLLDWPVVALRQEITAAVAPAEVAPLIDVGVRQPVLRIDRLFFDSTGTPAHHAVEYGHPERCAYLLELRLVQASAR